MNLLTLINAIDQYFLPNFIKTLDAVHSETDHDAALREWAAAIDFASTNHADFALIPRLYARSGRHPALAEYEARMKGIYRFYFYRNSRLLVFVHRILTALINAGIEFIVFKGIATTMQYNESPALRFAADCDILIHAEDKTRATAVLEACGVSIPYDQARIDLDRHSHDFKDADENGLDLHWYALDECCWRDADAGFWQRSQDIDWKGLKLRVLSAEDQLLVAGMNGIKERGRPRGEWLSDAKLILASHPKLDWKALHAELSARNLSHHFLDALSIMSRFIPAFPKREAEEAFQSEIQSAVKGLVLQNRDSGLNAEEIRHLKDFLPGGLGDAADSHAIRYIRYTQHSDGSIAEVFLHPNLRKYLRLAFDIVDRKAVSRAVNHSIKQDRMHLLFPTGAMRLPAGPSRNKPRLRLKPKVKHLAFDRTQGSLVLDVQIQNLSFRPLIIHRERDADLSITYHLYSKGWRVLSWTHPVQYFLTSQNQHVAIMLPRAKLNTQLNVTRPPNAGRYLIRLDIEQGMYNCLDPYKQGFPKIRIEVSSPPGHQG